MLFVLSRGSIDLHGVEKEVTRRWLHLIHPVNLKVVALPVEAAHLLHPLGAKERREDF